MARLAKFSDAMSSMDVNCVGRGRGGAAMAWRGVGASRTRLDTARKKGAPVSLAQRFFGRGSACLAPLLLGDEFGHFPIDLLEGF